MTQSPSDSTTARSITRFTANAKPAVPQGGQVRVDRVDGPRRRQSPADALLYSDTGGPFNAAILSRNAGGPKTVSTDAAARS